MKRIATHVTKCIIAGVVGILPVGGLIVTVGYAEKLVSGAGLSDLPFYFPGLGLLTVAAGIYLVGLCITTFLGRWLWSGVDRVLDRLPALGPLYQTLKQILGYGKGADAIFQQVVLVPSRDFRSEELGLVTRTMPDGAEGARLAVFVPGVPNPTTGRLLILSQDTVTPLPIPVSEALKTLVSLGKTGADLLEKKLQQKTDEG